jgi:hypothetical protein
LPAAERSYRHIGALLEVEGPEGLGDRLVDLFQRRIGGESKPRRVSKRPRQRQMAWMMSSCGT